MFLVKKACQFMFVYIHMSNFSIVWQLLPFPVTGLQMLTYGYAWHLWLLAVRVVLCATPTGTWEVGLYSLI
jgi:hypothetical protein